MISKQDKYTQTIKNCNDKVSKLPAGEIKFYLFILINSINEKNTKMTNKFLDVLSELLDNLNDLNRPDSIKAPLFIELFKNYDKLKTIAQTNSLSSQSKIIVLQIGSTLASFVTGIVGGLTGGVVGLFRGTWNLEPFKGLGVGLFTGYFLGALVGFRSPKKLFKDELIRQIQFGLNGLNTCLNNLHQSLLGDKQEIKPFDKYFEAEKINIRNKCFTNDADFEQFLNSDVTYEINSFKAGFIGGSSLHGYLGQHLYIVININKNEFLIEFTQKPADTTEKPAQQELRTVKGSKIIEMLATYNKLQETTPCTLSYVALRLKPGDNDCHTLINKVLIGTNQPATTLTRYNDMNKIGSTIGFFITKLSPFKEDFYNTSEPTLV